MNLQYLKELWLCSKRSVLRRRDKALDIVRAKIERQNEVKIFTFQDAVVMTEKWSKQIPSNFDVIIGVPRGGLLMAAILASKFNKPLSTPENFARGEIWYSRIGSQSTNIRNVLFVEDSVGSGSRIKSAIDSVCKRNPNIIYKTAALCWLNPATFSPDYYFFRKQRPIIFEWNLLINSYGECVDMDGVLCADCPPHYDDDGGRYMKWIENAKPHLIPSFEIEAIITSRLEKYRQPTIDWLNRHNVKYKKLIMLNLPSKNMRTEKIILRHKIDNINKLSPFWYWESDYWQAVKIRKQVKCKVLCIDKLLIL
ncbi:MAG: phosphoribosyltransferase family protein [Candidatus Bathyarchaeia archaeon]